VIVNRSLLEVLQRSLTTQLNAIFIMVCILLFGGATIKQFIAIMLIGLISGTYSSLFNAVPLVVSWNWASFAPCSDDASRDRYKPSPRPLLMT